MYERIVVPFLIWYEIYVGRNGPSETGLHIRDFLRDMTLAWKLVPGLEHIEENSNILIPPNFTHQQKEKIYKYFHENPNKWAKHVLGL